VILDFDGVVLESNAVKTEAFRDVFARFPEHAEAMMDFHRAREAIDEGRRLVRESAALIRALSPAPLPPSPPLKNSGA
jgi:beta-phosphoglucomutase-like phosphatase (HAD superfamily)